MIFFIFYLKELLKLKIFVYKVKDNMYMYYLRNLFLDFRNLYVFLFFIF